MANSILILKRIPNNAFSEQSKLSSNLFNEQLITRAKHNARVDFESTFNGSEAPPVRAVGIVSPTLGWHIGSNPTWVAS